MNEFEIHINGSCNEEAYQKILDVVNTLDCDESYDMKIPNTWEEAMEYIKGNIIILRYPIVEKNSNFHSLYIYRGDSAKPVIFINTNEYLDNQNLYLAHELYYHFYRDTNKNDADYFATKLLLPKELLDSFDSDNLMKSIKRIHKCSGAPFSIIIRVLYDRGYIDDDTYLELKKVNPRFAIRGHYNKKTLEKSIRFC